MLRNCIFHVNKHVGELIVSLPVVLPPVLVPRNPEVIAARYEPIPSYLDTQRSVYSPDNECPSLHFDTPGNSRKALHSTLSM